MTEPRIESDNGYAYVLVDSTGHALRAEKRLAAAGVPSKLVPVPRHLSSDCGVCVRIRAADAQTAQAVLGGDPH